MLNKPNFVIIIALAVCQIACSQQAPTNRLGHCNNPKFDRTVAFWLSFKVPAIDVDSLVKMRADNILVLDAREAEEYAVSHIPGAKNCGYDHFDLQSLNGADKSKPVVIYCSIGYRSEKIASKLKNAGFSQVYNLYGSIFEWVNRGYGLVDMQEKPTFDIHTFNKSWGKWVNNSLYRKIH